ncbi:TPA: helix-turn-helix transcriptional regulator [Neisseria meningitidis]
MNRVERIKNLIADRFNGNQAEFSRAINKAPAQINQWLNGYRNIGDGVAAQIETALGLPRGWVDGKDEPGTPVDSIKSNATVIGTVDAWDSETPLSDDDCEVPFYKDVCLSAGNGFSDDIEDHNGYKLRFSKSTLRRHGISPDDVVCVSADGDSMEPVFPDGATLGINTADKIIKDGKIYAINHGGLLRTKILQKLPDNQVRIKSYNPEYKDETAPLDSLTVIGRVFWWSVLD